MHSVKDVNFNKHLLHLFPKKLEYTFFWDTRYNTCSKQQAHAALIYFVFRTEIIMSAYFITFCTIKWNTSVDVYIITFLLRDLLYNNTYWKISDANDWNLPQLNSAGTGHALEIRWDWSCMLNVNIQLWVELCGYFYLFSVNVTCDLICQIQKLHCT